MFAQLKSVVDLIRSGISGFRNFRDEKEREETIVQILETYFLFKDCVDEGEMLVADAGPDPVGKIAAMDTSLALITIARWDAILRRQGIRLFLLRSYVVGQDHLVVINPELLDKIKEVIGHKMQRAVTLHGIGAALHIKNTFPVANAPEEKAKYVALLAGEEGNAIDMPRVTNEVVSLREALEQYRHIVERLVSDAELLRLSQRARLQTTIE